MKKILVLLLAAALLLVTCGCTESAPEAPSTPPPSTLPTTTKAPSPRYVPTTTVPTLTQAATVNDNIILIKREGFIPANLTVKKGVRVTWLNTDTTDDQAAYNPTHRIRVKNAFDSQVIAPGTSTSWIFTKTGVYYYSDLIHTDIHGAVVVE